MPKRKNAATVAAKKGKPVLIEATDDELHATQSRPQTITTTTSAGRVTMTTTIVHDGADWQGEIQGHLNKLKDQCAARPSWAKRATTALAVAGAAGAAFAGTASGDGSLAAKAAAFVPTPIIDSIAPAYAAAADAATCAWTGDQCQRQGERELVQDQDASDEEAFAEDSDPLASVLAKIQRERDSVPAVLDQNGVDVSPQAKARAWLAENLDMNTSFDYSGGNSDIAIPLEDAIAERYALAVFYYSLNGDEWNSSLNFLSSGSVCGWNGMLETGAYDEEDALDEQDDVDPHSAGENLDNDDDDMEYEIEAGITCNVQGSVTSISITHENNLSGSLPAELDLLKNLQVFDIHDQHIEGPIPIEMTTLTQIRRLSLQNTAVSGTIPSQLAKLTSLEELSLVSGSFWGNVPDEIGRMVSKLTSLQLANNMFIGSVPKSIGFLSELEELDLSGNQLSGSIPPSMFYMLSSLRTLNLAENELTGAIPSEMAMLDNSGVTNLAIDLSSNELSGTIPKEIAGMTKSLEQFLVSDNRLTGEIPSEFGKLRDILMTLYVQNNRLSGTVPQELQGMPWMFHVDLSRNDLVGSLDGVFCEQQHDAPAELYRIAADCGSSEDKPAEVVCSCCTKCCVDGQDCFEEGEEANDMYED